MSVRTSQTLPDEIDTPHPSAAIGRALKVAPRASGGAAYASSRHLAALADYLDRMTEASRDTGWHSPQLMASLGEGEESIVIGVRWISNAYHAEIR